MARDDLVRRDLTVAGVLSALLSACGAASLEAPPAASTQAVVATPPIGVYAVWHGTRQDVFASSAVVGGQVWAQWAQVEPAPGRYDFSLLERRLEAVRQAGRRATVQLNANLHPDWVFDAVPYLPERLHTVRSPRGTPMYWHPRYVAAQLALIDALGEWIAANPHRESIAAVRMSFNAVGTEGLAIPREHQRAAQWRRAQGVTAGDDWSHWRAITYASTIAEHYIDRIAPESFLLVRRAIFQPGKDRLGSSEEGAELRARLQPLLDQGGAGIFHTSSDIQPRNRGYSREVYGTMRTLCREARRPCYAEAITTARGRRTDYPTTIAPSAGQWFYWRVLSDLTLGISHLAVNRQDLIRYEEPGFAEGLAFAERYLGAHLSPALAAGAWLAFREGDFLPGDYGVLSEAEGCGERRSGVGPEDHPYGLWATRLRPGVPCEVTFDGEFLAGAASQPLQLQLIARAASTGSPAGTLALAGISEARWSLPDDGAWYTLRVDLPSSSAGRAPFLRLRATGGAVDVHRIELQRTGAPRLSGLK